MEAMNLLMIFLVFTHSQLGIEINKGDINQCYRLGKVNGKRPLFVSFTKLDTKDKVMKNAYKLKGTTKSLSNDLTNKARTRKKFVLACANQARAAGHIVKVSKNKIIVGNIAMNYQELNSSGWLVKLGEKLTASNSDKQLKRPRNDSQNDSNNSNEEKDLVVTQENDMPPPSRSEGEGKRSRSSSLSKRAKKN